MRSAWTLLKPLATLRVAFFIRLAAKSVPSACSFFVYEVVAMETPMWGSTPPIATNNEEGDSLISHQSAPLVHRHHLAFDH